MTEIMQHAFVSLVALLAAWVVVRRIVGTFGPSPAGPQAQQACPTCASGCAHAARTAERQRR